MHAPCVAQSCRQHHSMLPLGPGLLRCSSLECVGQLSGSLVPMPCVRDGKLWPYPDSHSCVHAAARAHLHHLAVNGIVLLHRPLRLGYGRAQVVIPSLAALLPRATAHVRTCMGRTQCINGCGYYSCVIAPALAPAPRQDCDWARPVPHSVFRPQARPRQHTQRPCAAVCTKLARPPHSSALYHLRWPSPRPAAPAVRPRPPSTCASSGCSGARAAPPQQTRAR